MQDLHGENQITLSLYTASSVSWLHISQRGFFYYGDVYSPHTVHSGQHESVVSQAAVYFSWVHFQITDCHLYALRSKQFLLTKDPHIPPRFSWLVFSFYLNVSVLWCQASDLPMHVSFTEAGQSDQHVGLDLYTHSVLFLLALMESLQQPWAPKNMLISSEYQYDLFYVIYIHTHSSRCNILVA